MRIAPICVLSLAILMFGAGQLYATDWSITEVQHQFGRLQTPSFAGTGKSGTHSITLQHASGWSYGENFFFVDLTNSSNANFNDADMYSEWYPAISLGKLFSRNAATGPFRDFSVLAGLNFAATPRVIKVLPGIRLSLNLPKFAFANLDVMAYLDFSEGVERGGAPSEDNAFIVDFNWALPFKISSGEFSIEGHIEYVGARNNEFGEQVKWHLLGQPQFRFDLGRAAGGSAGRIFVGTEIQFWINKLGDPDTNEFAPQTLIVWRF
jgi:nucleoside-specific outer membrane channel protein Tsx